MERPEIEVLRSEVIDQIAAGEVVERPASVIKELVENALDAGATRIHVEIREGGRRLMRVVDNGVGLSAEELPLALQRHATSKLRAVADLDALASMGFRGEALPTIASVSRFTITSRPRQGGLGATLRVEGGQAGEVEPAGCPPGTTVEAADLFFNTPARLKFLKSTATEGAHISDMVNRAALCAPQVHFSLTVDGRKPLDLPPCKNRLERCRAVLPRWADRLRAGQQRSPGGWRAEAVVAPPSDTLRTSRQLVMVVNGRHVRDRALMQAVTAGFGHTLDRGRFPVAVIYLDLPPDAVDVNVHPQKTEVRFAEPRRAFSLIKRCVEELAAASTWLDSPPAQTDSPRAPAGAAPSTRRAPPPPRTSAPARKYTLRGDSGGKGYDEHKDRLMEATRRFWSRRPASPAPPMAEERLEPAYVPDPEPGLAGTDMASAGFFSALKVIGQALGQFVICEGRDEIVLLDRHAARARVTYERLRSAGQGGAALPSQRLLVPAQLELDDKLAAVAREAADTLASLGLELEPFGGDAWTVRSLPAMLADAEPEALARDLLSAMAGGEGADARDALYARLAAHGDGGQERGLTQDEVLALLKDLDRVDFSDAGPHSAAIMVRLSRTDLEGKLG